jgi:hypothetical protein
MKPEQLEIEKLRREVAKLKAERDILKKPRWVQPVNAAVRPAYRPRFGSQGFSWAWC